MDKIDERISNYKKAFERKQNLLRPLQVKKGRLEDLTSGEYLTLYTLEAEMRQIKEFIEDLQYIRA